MGYHYRLVARRHGMVWDEREVNGAFGAAWKAMPAPVTTRVLRPDDDRGWWRELVWRVLDEMKPEAGFDRERFFVDLYGHFAEPGVWELYPEVRDVLARLRERFKLGIVSNFDGRLRSLLAQFGILDLFEVVAISSEVGADKPDPFLFEAALAMAGVRADEALHVGDDPVHDWEGAEAAGIRCFRLERPGNSLVDLVGYLEAGAVAGL